MAQFGTFFQGDLSWFERGCLSSFVAHGHQMTLYSYDPMPVPADVINADAADIVPREKLFSIAKGSHKGGWSAFANLFRYAMIPQTGLIWVDTDVWCLSPDWPTGLPFLAGFQDPWTINCAVLGGRRDHALFADAYAMADHIGPHSIWGYTGPHLVTALVGQHGLHPEVLPIDTFYPVRVADAGKLLAPMPGARTIGFPPSALAVHLWHELLRFGGLDRQAGPPNQSILRLLFEGG